MTNASIYAAFERMWKHITDKFATAESVAQKSQIQIITWGADD